MMALRVSEGKPGFPRMGGTPISDPSAEESTLSSLDSWHYVRGANSDI